ncbi:MAG: hypothetical protein KDB14_33055 [Planctomycetales bacterium]|nr:hypothetical protein [Planctomycetales bacterium]
MSDKLAEKLGHAIESPPVWCWHSCGNPGIGPTVQTALSLFGSSISQVERVTIRLDVPDDYMVLSSYFCWCEILNLVIEGTPVEQDSLSEMLSEPLMSPEGDDVQAVLPYIDPRWVVAICPLVTANRSTHLPV